MPEEKKMVGADASSEATLDELRKYLSSSIFVQVGPKSAKK